jgi:predicted  nucleic acid-binding Zn-ribbon protein
MSDLQKNKQVIETDLANLSIGIVEIGKRLKKAKEEGKEADPSLLDNLRLFEGKAEELQNQYSSLQEEEAKPQLEEAWVVVDSMRHL